MQLSAKSEYACLAMAELAKRHGRGIPTSLKEIARELGLSHPFLMQIFMALKSARLATGLRGPGGGFKLARTPDAVSLLDIVEAIDGPERDASALASVPNVPLVRSLQDVQRKSRQAARAVLRSTSLGDLVRQTQELGALEFQI